MSDSTHATRARSSRGFRASTKYVFSRDHKIIGIQFLFYRADLLRLGGLLAMAVRWQLAWPWTPMPILGQLALVQPVAGRPDAARVLQHAVHDARHGDDLLRDHPDPDRRVRQLPDPADDRRHDMAFPTLNMLRYWFMWPAFI